MSLNFLSICSIFSYQYIIYEIAVKAGAAFQVYQLFVNIYATEVNTIRCVCSSVPTVSSVYGLTGLLITWCVCSSVPTERIVEAQGKYKSGVQQGLGAHPKKLILHALKCVLGASEVPFCACIQYIPTCQLAVFV